MTTAPQLLDRQIAHLHNNGRLRVWSLVITIFGDAVQLRGRSVAMADLQALTEHVGVEVGALRTAMSRLAKDGWVMREKQSRKSFYALTAHGTRDFADATRRIYQGQHSASTAPVTIGIAQTRPEKSRVVLEKFLATSGAVILRSGCAIWAEGNRPDAHAMQEAGIFSVTAQAGSVPAWVKDHLGTPDRANGFNQLRDRWAVVAENVSQLHELSPLDAMALRLLLIHDWRRTLLRVPDMPEQLLPDNWPEPECRSLVGTIYHALLPTSEAWWPTQVTPSGMDALERRFPTQSPVTQRNFISI